jgi:hypothetical protein
LEAVVPDLHSKIIKAMKKGMDERSNLMKEWTKSHYFKIAHAITVGSNHYYHKHHHYHYHYHLDHHHNHYHYQSLFNKAAENDCLKRVKEYIDGGAGDVQMNEDKIYGYIIITIMTM